MLKYIYTVRRAETEQEIIDHKIQLSIAGWSKHGRIDTFKDKGGKVYYKIIFRKLTKV